jgi:hypothetical protein
MDFTKHKPLIYLFFILLAVIMLYFIFDLITLDANQLPPPRDSNILNDNNFPVRSRPISFFLLSPIMGFVGAIIGALLIYFLLGRISKSQVAEKTNTRIILNFLTDPEKKVIEILIANKGQTFQYELTRIPGLSRVKTHRLLKSLEDKGIITLEKYGKINKVILNKELYEVLTKQ